MVYFKTSPSLNRNKTVDKSLQSFRNAHGRVELIARDITSINFL